MTNLLAGSGLKAESCPVRSESKGISKPSIKNLFFLVEGDNVVNGAPILDAIASPV